MINAFLLLLLLLPTSIANITTAIITFSTHIMVLLLLPLVALLITSTTNIVSIAATTKNKEVNQRAFQYHLNRKKEMSIIDKHRCFVFCIAPIIDKKSQEVLPSIFIIIVASAINNFFYIFAFNINGVFQLMEIKTTIINQQSE